MLSEMSFLRRLFAIPSLLELREDLEKTQRELRGTRLDLSDLWDRFSRLQGRLAKRGELNPVSTETSADENGGPGPSLTGRALTIQEQILARRGHRVSR